MKNAPVQNTNKSAPDKANYSNVINWLATIPPDVWVMVAGLALIVGGSL